MVPENREFDFGQTDNCKSKSGEPENHDIIDFDQSDNRESKSGGSGNRDIQLRRPG